jgi:hypothetical protein
MRGLQPSEFLKLSHDQPSYFLLVSSTVACPHLVSSPPPVIQEQRNLTTLVS